MIELVDDTRDEDQEEIATEGFEAEQIPGEEDPNDSTQAIKPTTFDEVGDVQKVININKDKLVAVDNQVIVDACEEMQEIDEQRAELTEQAGAIRAKLKNLGIPTTAFNGAYSRFKINFKDRAEVDAAYAKCCIALDVGYQTELWGGNPD